jgi:hypothetical protein
MHIACEQKTIFLVCNEILINISHSRPRCKNRSARIHIDAHERNVFERHRYNRVLSHSCICALPLPSATFHASTSNAYIFQKSKAFYYVSPSKSKGGGERILFNPYMINTRRFQNKTLPRHSKRDKNKTK